MARGKKKRRGYSCSGCLFRLFLLAVLIGLGVWFYSGGSLEPLWKTASEAREHLPNFAKAARSWLDAAAKRASQSVEKGKEVVGKIEEKIPSELPSLPELPPMTRTMPFPLPGSASTNNSLTAYFGPSAEADPNGIDDALVAFLGTAQATIDCACYELQLPSVAEVLVREHSEGTTVRIVTDSEHRDRPALARVMAAGVPVVFDDRSPFMHNKFCVVDGTSVWTGSMNFTENGAIRNNNNALQIVSPELAANYTTEFTEMFDGRAFGRSSPRTTPYPLVTVGGTHIASYFAPEDDVEEVIVAELETAQMSIDFLAFSFTSAPIADLMAEKAAAGIRVRGVFETRAAGGAYSKDEFLARAGAQVFHDGNPYTMHHKVIIIDGMTVITGSYNFSKSANEKNDENVLILESEAIGKAYTAEFERVVGK